MSQVAEHKRESIMAMPTNLSMLTLCHFRGNHVCKPIFRNHARKHQNILTLVWVVDGIDLFQQAVPGLPRAGTLVSAAAILRKSF